jgi:hypothetical protein
MMPESFTLDTSCSDRPIHVTASGRVLDSPPRPAAPKPAADGEQDQAPADTSDRKLTAKILTTPARPAPSTGAKPKTK